MLKEFKEFAMRGNVIDMAVGIIMGGAFGQIVTKIVEIITNLISAAISGVEFSQLSFKIGKAKVAYGGVLQAIINFLIIALFMFLMVKAINKMFGKKEEEVEVTTKSCPYCLSEISIKATRCPNCTSELEGYSNPIENN
ncbi:large conductance mechanosensitive channel protein MscL [Miniphocaeibacter massiliensis]|uniref:large conductance mechanosensitive channel protein MscL n=1 Tax=Miniphocaeibacter massiliensis TaxID=2041841 RepID=UPI000C1BB74C|nr:large conductance mechanosensitive channel protein MscL [Miniphocaeibacter massiliensis]